KRRAPDAACGVAGASSLTPGCGPHIVCLPFRLARPLDPGVLIMSRSRVWKRLTVSAVRKELETLEDRATPSPVPHAVARPAWTDTDGSNPVAVRVLANDSPSQARFAGRPVTLLPGSIEIVRGPEHGTVTVNHHKGTVIYRAEAGFTGTDTFRYT